jgi:TetR/AcrR family transcriptional repressor of nem operon
MKEIVDQTGLSKGAFYHYFSSKEQVFEEVIQHFFRGMMITDYDQFDQESLFGFYTGILSKIEKDRKASKKLFAEDTNKSLSHNYYYLIFDAMRMLPDFKREHQVDQENELRAWTKIISIAKQSNEIKTLMVDDVVARLFIYLGDGVNINLVINDLSGNKANELKNLWDALYSSLKT